MLHGDAHNRDAMHGIRSLVAQQSTLERLTRHIEDLQRVQRTPEPWAFQKHLRLTILLWLWGLPLTLLPSMLWATPLVASSMAYVIFKLEDVAVEVQNPYGFTQSDIALCLLNDRLQAEMLCAMSTYAMRHAHRSTE